MFWTLIHPSSGAATFLLYHHIGCVFLFRCVLELRCGWVGVVSVWQAEAVLQELRCGWVGVVSVWQAEALFQPATRIPPQPATPKLQHTSKQEHTTNVSQAPDDGFINVRNMLSI